MRDLEYPVTDAELASIGILLTSNNTPQSPSRELPPLDLESILFKICVCLQRNKWNGRLASALGTWFQLHGDRVFVDRLCTYRERFCEEYGEDVYWLRYFAFFNTFLRRHSWKRLTMAMPGEAGKREYYFGSDASTARMFIDRWGLEVFLPPNCKIKVHRNALRIRESDVLGRKALMQSNLQYANRFRYGSNVRSDVATFMESGYFRSAYDLSKFLCLSRESVRKNWADMELYAEVERSKSI